MANRIQLRRDTYQNWYNNNPVLFEGEIALDTTNRKIKIGDGSTHWRNLLNANVTPEELASSNPSELGIAIDQSGNLVLSNDNAIILDSNNIYRGGVNDSQLIAQMSWVDVVSAGTGIVLDYQTRNYATAPNKRISVDTSVIARKTDIPEYVGSNTIVLNQASGGNSYQVALNIKETVDIKNNYNGNYQPVIRLHNSEGIKLRPYGFYNGVYESTISTGYYGALEIGSSQGIFLNSETGVFADGGLVATRPWVSGEISNLVNSAPSTLNTLKELADALADDPNFATTITNLIGTKIATSQKGVANGVATLDSAGQIPATQLGNASGGSTAIHSFAMIG